MKYMNVDEYINCFDGIVKEKLNEMRDIIKSVAIDAEEVISYNMPAYKLNKVLVYFAANKNHIGFYPTPAAIVQFKEDLNEYKTSKGAIQFQLDESLPIELIKKIVKFRVDTDI